MKYYDEFCKFYDKTYKDLGYQDKISGTNLSQMIKYTSDTIENSNENNNQNNFIRNIFKVCK